MGWNDAMTTKIMKEDMKLLELLSKRPMAAPLMDDDQIVRAQKLASRGLAHDFSHFHGQQLTLVRLRIWGITERGRAILEQRELTETRAPRQLTLTKGLL